MLVKLLLVIRLLSAATYTVSVDYSYTIADMIKAGKYDRIDRRIKKHFSIRRQAVRSNINTVLVHLDKKSTTNEVRQHLDKLGLRSARIEELLAFGEKYPDIQRQFPVIALGSVWVGSDGRRRVPALDSWDSERDLDLGLDDPDGGWGGFCRFLAVSK